MEELMQLIVQNGIGVGSFMALLYFINKYISNMNITLENMTETLTTIKESLLSLTNRVSEIENKMKGGEEHVRK